jgi:WD40 repeat protein
VGGIAATFVILAAGAIVSTVQAVRAMRAERLASTRLVEATEARALAQQREAEAMDARQLADNRRLEAEASFARAEEARRLAEAQREANRALLYVSDLTLAQRTLEDGNHARAVELLERHRPAPGVTDLRHFEWDHLWRATHRFERAFTLPAAYFIGGFAVAPEAGLVAGGGADGSVRVWEIATGRERYAGVLKGGITQLALSSDGTRVAAGTRANVIAVVDVGSARQIAAFSTTRLPGALRFAGADRLIEAGASVGVIRELTASREVRSDVAPQQVVPGGAEPMLVSLRQGVPWIVTSTGETALTPDGRLRNMAVSEDGSRLMTYTVAGTLALWDTRGKLLTTFPADRAIGGWMALSSQGRYLAALTPPATVTIWEVVTGKAVASLAAPAGIGSPRAVRFSPSGALLAIGGAAGVIVFDVGGGRERALLRGHSASANVVFVDEETVVTQASDSVKVWRLSAQADLAMPLDMRGQVFVQASRDGRWFAAASNETTTRVTPDGARTTVPRSVLRAWTLTGAAMSRPVELPVSMTAVAIAGPRLVLAGDSSGRVHAWDPASDAAPAGFAAHDAAIGAIAVSADGALTATTARPDQIRLWSRRDGRLVTTLAHPMVNDVTFGPAGRMLASCGSDGDVRLWTVGARTAPRVLQAQPGQVQAVAFSPDGRVLASGHVDGQVVLWDVASGREMTRLRGHSGPVQALVFSRDGHRLVSAGGDAAVRLWDMATLGEVQHLRADVSFFNSVDLVPAGLVAGAAGRTPLLLWRR